MEKYKLAVSFLLNLLESISEYSDYMLIYHNKSRIKTPGSIKKKFDRYGWAYSKDAIDVYLYDVAGVRVICPFISDVYKVIDAIKRDDSLRVVAEKDYIKNKKPTMYAGYHMQVEVPVNVDGEIIYVKAEIQLRTIAMDIFNSLEHKLRYKDWDLFEACENNTLANLGGSIHLIDENLDRSFAEKSGNVSSRLLKTNISGEALPSHTLAMKCLKDYIEGVRLSYKKASMLDPVEFIMPKYNLGNIYNTTEGAVLELNVVCSFLHDVNEIVSSIRATESFVIVNEANCTNCLGQSWHVFLVKVPVILDSGEKVWVDAKINVKTIIMDFCGVVEYILSNSVGLSEDVITQLKTTTYSLRLIEAEFANLASIIFARKKSLKRLNCIVDSGNDD